MNHLVAYYDESPVDAHGSVEIEQLHISSAAGWESLYGSVRTAVVYVVASRAGGQLLVPFGAYDEWSLRDRYNEAIRIMSVLGASTITCETFGEVEVRRGLGAKILGRGGGKLEQQRLENSGFDYRHAGTGSAPRDPRPLSWPDEPGFSAAVTSVLENGVTAVDINIRSNRVFATDGSLGVQLAKLGFLLEGQSKRSSATSLRLEATFPQGRKGRR